MMSAGRADETLLLIYKAGVVFKLLLERSNPPYQTSINRKLLTIAYVTSYSLFHSLHPISRKIYSPQFKSRDE